MIFVLVKCEGWIDINDLIIQNENLLTFGGENGVTATLNYETVCFFFGVTMNGAAMFNATKADEMTKIATS